MTAVGNRKLSFFDEGIVEGGGIWGACLTGELGHKSSGVINRLSALGLWDVQAEDGDDGSWWSLTALGAAVANALATPADVPTEPTPVPVVDVPAFSDITPAQAAAGEAPGIAKAVKFTRTQDAAGTRYTASNGWTISKSSTVAPGGRGGKRETAWSAYPTTDTRPARGTSSLPGYAVCATLAEAKAYVIARGDAAAILSAAHSTEERDVSNGTGVVDVASHPAHSLVNASGRGERSDMNARPAPLPRRGRAVHTPADLAPVITVTESGVAKIAAHTGQTPAQVRAAAKRQGMKVSGTPATTKRGNAGLSHFPNRTVLGSPIWSRPADAADNFRALATATTGKARAFWTVQAEVCAGHVIAS
jgi:hypothetical protein